jgi:hypothetical protein
MARLLPLFDLRRPPGYIEAVRYLCGPVFLSLEPFMPFPMGFRQVFDKIPAFLIYPLIDRLAVG